MDATVGSGMKPGAAWPAGELVRLTGVHKIYGRGLAGVRALSDINLSVAGGEMVAICGQSGHGKTCLMNLIGMLEAATEGSVIVANLLTSKLTEQARAGLRNEMVGYVFQSFSLVPVLTAQENVMLPLLLRASLAPDALAEAQAYGSELLARVGLKTQTHHYPSQLDAGQCQRVAIARALITGPRLVLADEPASRMDSGSIRLVMDLFAAHQRQFGTTIIMATRDQRQMSRVTRTLQLQEGRLTGTPVDAPRKTLRVQG
jgi:putative ABC transport system ATP-binding protein